MSLTDNILVHYSFDETSGATFADSSVGGLDGTWSGTRAWDTGKVRGCASFTNNSPANAVIVPDLGTHNKVTFSWWQKPTSYGGTFDVVYASDGFSAGAIHLNFLGSPNALQLGIGPSTGVNFGDNTNWPTGQWTHIVATYDSVAGSAKVYANGELVGTQSVTPGQPAVLGQAAIGTWSGDATRSFNGLIDEFTVWSDIKTAEEIRFLYNYNRGLGYAHWSNPLVESFRNSKVVPSAHFNVETFTTWEDYEIGSPTEDPASIFAPTKYDHWESWLDECQKFGADIVYFTVHYHEGFTTTPSAFTVYSLSNPECLWFVEKQVDVFQDFCTQARIRGMKVGLYFNIEDKWYEENETGSYTYQEWIVEILTDLLTNYGTIYYIFFDAWGDNYWSTHDGVSYAQVDYDVINSLVTSLQPNCIFSVNDHVHTSSTFLPGLVDLWERTVEGAPQAGQSDYAAVALHDTVHEPGPDLTARWYFHADSPPDVVYNAETRIDYRYQMWALGQVYMPNFSPGPTGKMHSSTVAMLKEMNPLPYWQDPAYDADFSTGAPPTALTTKDSNWVLVGGSDLATINPTNEVWANGSAALYARGQRDDTDFRYKLSFVPKSIAGTVVVYLSGCAKTDSITDYRAVMAKVGSNPIKISLNKTINGANTDLGNFKFPMAALTVGRQYDLYLQKIGTELRAEFWEDQNGTMRMVCKVFASDSELDSGDVGFGGFGDSASSSTGIHITEISVQLPDLSKPQTPQITLTLGGGGDDDYISYEYDVDDPPFLVKIYEYNNLAGWQMVGMHQAESIGDTFTDPSFPKDMELKAYVVRFVGRNWRHSGYSNVVGDTSLVPSSRQNNATILGIGTTI